ncbi:putative F-box domain, galactose oxidase/kelch, beta-propeller, F-box associated interaction [Helianthus annuus]|nr:putative F-box domain, galactose oxidase/kelch, beta-propeller, F-box associated interaction [Helianthus annuus]
MFRQWIENEYITMDDVVRPYSKQATESQTPSFLPFTSSNSNSPLLSNEMDPNHTYFVDEIILEILARLPIKSLIRTKCVCKLWYNLASHKSFTQLYNHLSLKNAMLLLQVTDSSTDSTSSMILLVDHKRGVSEFSLDFIKDRVKIRASCNGLLCCSSVPDKGVYYVCNPMTREFKLLPRSRERPVTRFYPDGEATLVGLTCDLLSNRYNVVLAGYHRMFGHRPEGKLICSVYDSGTNKWRKYVSDQDDHGFTHMNRNQVVFVNGSLHWMTQSFAYILVLDLSLDSWRRILLPEEMGCGNGSGNRVYLLEFDGKLSVIQISSVWMNIWVLQDYGKGKWDLIDRVSLRCIRGMVPGIFPISQGGDYVFLAGHKQVLVYQRKTRSWKEMYSVKNNSTMPLWFSAHSFRGTIFSCR